MKWNLSEYEEQLAYLDRYIVIGAPGAGKTTLSNKLGKILSIKVVYLDSLFWKPGWQKTSRKERLRILERAMEPCQWILDGNYESVLELQLENTQGVIFLDFPRWLCFLRVILRRLSKPPEVAPGCPDKIDLQFLKKIWNFPHGKRQAILNMLLRHSEDKVIITLTNPYETRMFLHHVAHHMHQERQ